MEAHGQASNDFRLGYGLVKVFGVIKAKPYFVCSPQHPFLQSTIFGCQTACHCPHAVWGLLFGPVSGWPWRPVRHFATRWHQMSRSRPMMAKFYHYGPQHFSCFEMHLCCVSSASGCGVGKGWVQSDSPVKSMDHYHLHHSCHKYRPFSPCHFSPPPPGPL